MSMLQVKDIKFVIYGVSFEQSNVNTLLLYSVFCALYYGTPLVIDKQELSKIKWPVLGIFGDKDQAIPLSNIKQFKTANFTKIAPPSIMTLRLNT